jgi:hypothetical protein
MLNYKFINWEPPQGFADREEYIAKAMYEGIGVDMTYGNGRNVERVWLSKTDIHKEFGIKLPKDEYLGRRKEKLKAEMLLAAESPEVEKYFIDYAEQHELRIL